MPTLWEIANAEAQRQGVDPRLVAAVMHTESRGRATARSPAGAYGPMQLMPGTAKDLGVDINDPADNIRGGVKYLGQMLKRFGGDTQKALAGYNAGPGAVDKHGGVPPYRETQDYVRKITGLMGGQVAAPQQQEAPVPKHGIDIDPSWLEGASEPAAKSPASARAAVAKGPQQSAIDPSWLEPAGAPAAQAAKARVQPAAAGAPYTGDTGLPNSLDELGARLRGILPVQTDPRDGKLKMQPGVGGVVKGIAGIPALADRLGAKIGSALGAKPQRGFADDLDAAVDARILKPANATEAMIGKGGEFVGSGIAGGGVVGGVGKGLVAAGAKRAGGALLSAGAVTPGSVTGSVTGGAAANVADELVGKHVESPVLRTAINLGAGVVGGGFGANLGNRVGGVPRNAETAATLAAARDANIPVQASDISPAVAKIKQGIVDKVPFGNLTAGGVPARQVEGVQRELRSTAERYRPADLNPGAGTTGADRYLAKDLRSGYRAAKDETNKAYAEVSRVMEANPGLPPIKLDAVRAQVKALEDEFPDTFQNLTLSTKAREILGTLKGASTPKQLDEVMVGGKPISLTANPQLRAALEAAGVSTTTKLPTVTMQQARDLSSELADVARRAERAAVMGGGSQKQVGALKQLGGAVKADVDAYMAQAPADVQAAYQNADQVFQTRVLPYRADPKVAKLVSSRTPQGDVDTEAQGLYDNLFNTAQGERSAMALQLMTPKGKQAAAYQALKEAGEKGLSNTGPEGLKAVSASRALDIEGNPALANIAQHYPELAKEADRLKSLLQIGRGASAALGRKGAATGIQNMPLVSGGLMAAGGNQLGQVLGNAPLGYGIMVGAPIAGANAFNALNRIGARAVANGPGSVTSRVTPGVIQGLLAEETDEEPKPRKNKKSK